MEPELVRWLMADEFGELDEFAPPAWSIDAACAGTDPAVFFPEKGHSTAEAKALCGECPVRDECLDYALTIESTPGTAGHRHGVWGGLSPKERRRLGRQDAQAA